MTDLPDKLQDEIRQAAAILKDAGAREVYLFGSLTVGRPHENSDIDLAVSGLSPEVFFNAMGKTSNVVSRSLDLVDLDEVSPFTQYLKDRNKLVRIA